MALTEDGICLFGKFLIPETVFTLGTLASLSTIKHIFGEWIKHGKPADTQLVGQVSDLIVYPVKSCRGVSVQEAVVTTCGLVDPITGSADRHFMIVDGSDHFLSQRKEPKLCLVTPSYHGDMLHIDAPGKETLIVPLHPTVHKDSSVSMCTVWDDEIAGLDCGSEAAEWFSTYLGRQAKLVYSGPGLTKRELYVGYSEMCRTYDKVAFQDWGQTLLISDSSVDHLNSRLENKVTMANFRPNLTVSNNVPHDEDDWHKIYIGENVQMTNVKLCGRCSMITVDPEKGVKAADRQPLNTIKQYRMKPPRADPCFGINVFCDVEGTISVGDPVQVTYKD